MQFHDMGKLMLAFVMLFAYFSFSQWLIIWAGNLPEEIGWFLNRIRGGWGVVALIIILFHFALPFALLLSRERKRAGSRLIGLALLLLFMRLVDIYWYVVPNFAHERGHFYLSIWYIVAPIGIGGLWLALFFYNLRQRPLLPLTSRRYRILLHQRSRSWPLRYITILCGTRRSITNAPTSAPRGILLFLIGLLLCGRVHRAGGLGDVPVHGEERRSVPAGADQSQMAKRRTLRGQPLRGSVMQNTPAVNLAVFPEPRLQVNDAGDMSKFLTSEQELLNPPQPFNDPSGSDPYSDLAGDEVD